MEKRNEKVTIHLSKSEFDKMKAHAKLEGFGSISEYVRNSINCYLNKDIEWQGQLQGTIEVLRKNIKDIAKTQDISFNYFKHFTKYFFAYTRSFQGLPESEKKILFDGGEKRAEAMFNDFKKTFSKNTRLLEMLTADMFLEEKIEEHE